MRRGVGSEAADRLGELSLGPDPPSAPGLVPGDGDVDEPLKEVAFVGRRRAPGELELLVRREVLACANELQSFSI